MSNLESHPESMHLSQEQSTAFDLLMSGENVFLTGGAGSGKSYLVKEMMKHLTQAQMPLLASTGAAAVLIGGRTFHSFFGLGIMDGGPDATFQRASMDSKLTSRLKKVEGVIIDEISMISGEALMIAEALSQKARDSNLPWGGLRVIVVGDFTQLPPVSRTQKRDWCFQNPVWEQSQFQPALLKANQRVSDPFYIHLLNQVRFGKYNQEIIDFLNSKLQSGGEDEPGTRLFPRRDQSEVYNQKKLAEIREEEVVIDSIYFGMPKAVESLKRSTPVPERLCLKIGCKVIFLQNDPQKRWINGTQGIVTSIEADEIKVEKLNTQREVSVEKTSLICQDADGNVIAQVIQFPLNLGYAATIHKSQGATMDELWCDLGALWEPGQAYVALSRLRESQGLKLIRWNPRSIIVDPAVLNFYKMLEGSKFEE